MRSFDEATRTARTRLDAEDLTPGERERMRADLFERPERGQARRVWVVASCAAALAAVAVIAYFGYGRGRDRDFVVLHDGAACVTRVEQGIEVTNGCRQAPLVAMDGAEATLEPGSVLLREQTELRLRSGRAAFAVSKRKPRQARFVVRVSVGAVVVTGTRFTVVENGQSGSVAVTEGTVEFHWADGAVAPVRAGEMLAWPRVLAAPDVPAQAVEPESTDEELEPEPEGRLGKAGPAMDPAALMRRLLQLRTQNRFDEAIVLLRDASHNRAYTAVQRERFGFELCNLVTQTQSTTKACGCWRRHMRAFPDSGRTEHLPEALHGCH